MDPSPVNNTQQDPKPYQQRYKGIENFLRRVAFNLGNSPSQTDVKIVSCIPIDVTDLQNKIVNLERQLHEARNSSGPPPTQNIPVNTALVNAAVPTTTFLSYKCSDVQRQALDNASEMTSQCADGSSKARKSTASFLFPSWSATGLYEKQNIPNKKEFGKEKLETSNGDHYKSFFRRAKKKKTFIKNLKPKTQLVYYAQTDNVPFNSFYLSKDNAYETHQRANIDAVFSKTYLTNVIQRHFDPEHVVEEFSDTSNFTSPVCRDSLNRVRGPESDICSCCHGQFQNIDNFVDKHQNFIIDPITHHYNRFNKNIYYDSKHYDMIPVKEKLVKVTKEEKLPKKERHVDIRCWPEHARYKQQRHLIQHHQKISTKSKNNRTPNTRLYDLSNNVRRRSPNYTKVMVDEEIRPTDTSNSCCVDCSDIYPKPTFTTQKTENSPPVRSVFRQNAECLTIDVGTNNLTITRSIQIDINSTENKTEETLNQIKSILQSVLAEVKTNPQINKVVEEKLTKDAIIQNGPSQNNIQTCSSLLHSFTYNNSYDGNPYIPTCSRQIPSNICYSNVPCQRFRCSQNFPLLIHAQPNRICGCVYKNSAQTSRPNQKQATTTATNTETGSKEEQGKETEKLIKEIYKSIALTMDFPKETSNSEYDESKSVTVNSGDRSDSFKVGSTVMSNVQKRDMQIETSMTPLSTTTVRSKDSSDSKQTEVDPYLKYESQSTEIDILPIKIPEIRMERLRGHIGSTISEHDSEDVSSDDNGEEEETKKDVKVRTEKKGLFHRMLGSVKLLTKKKNKSRGGTKQNTRDESEAEQSESNSDDYETIYSEKCDERAYLCKDHYYKPKSYQVNKPQYSKARNNRRSPYMEQEYRRQWEEKLMFQENRGRRYSSERPFSVQQTPPYWQNYEARSVIVDHNIPIKKISPVPNVAHKVEQQTSPNNVVKLNNSDKSKIGWLKKHKMGLNQCGDQWKKFILEN